MHPYDVRTLATPRPVEYVTLTGRPKVKLGPEELSFLPDKRYQLLSYLAYNGDWLGRERVAFLFWPDTDTANSRQNLRGLLQRLRGLPFDPEVEVTPHMLRWLPRTDVSEFFAAVEGNDIDTAIEAYKGPLLAGMEEEEAGEFGEWLEIERDRLHGEWRTVALRRLRECGVHEYPLATTLVRRLLTEDEFDEEAVRTYLVTMRRLGRTQEARTLFTAFVKRLEGEIGLEPSSETTAAFESLRDELPVPPITVTDASAATASVDAVRLSQQRAVVTGTRREPLPIPSFTLIGRTNERSEIGARLLDASCRQLTIVGPGGVGKSRLALAVAHDVAGEFRDGAAFVPLASVESTDDLPVTLARSLGIPLPPSGVLDHLRRVLSDMEVLLVLDNCEHLPGLSGMLSSALASAPGLKVLATSRGRLALTDEWLYQLEGLPFPAADDSVNEMLETPAIALFMERAKRVKPTFGVSSGEAEQLAQLGAYTEGMPLAIELAAAWVRALPLREIVSEMGRNLDLLISSAVDGNPRHASIRATFEQSWLILTPGEQQVMRRLAVFRGAAASDAAQFVAGASRAIVAALVDKSLLRLGSDQRYHQHPMWLAFTREKLARDLEEENHAFGRHATYYLRFLRERTDRARSSKPAGSLSEIDAELADILAAVEAARDRGNDDQLIALMHLLAIDTGYLPARGFGPRRIEMLIAAADAAQKSGDLESAHALHGRLADAYGTHQGDELRALKEYGTAAELAARSGNRQRQAVYLSMSGAMASRLEYPDAEDLLDEALTKAEATGDELCLATVLQHRATNRLIKGAYEEARVLFDQSLRAVTGLQESEDADPYESRRLRFFILINQGEVDLRLGHFERALEARQDALELAEESGNPIWAANARQELGEMYGAVGETRIAIAHLNKALALYKENHVTAHFERLTSFMVEHNYRAVTDVATTN